VAALFNARNPGFPGELAAALSAALAQSTSLPTHDGFSLSMT
jgi:hypothetical protein